MARPQPGATVVRMISKTAKTLSAATALAAIAGGFIGAGTAHAQVAQLSSANPNLDQLVQKGWDTYTGAVLGNKGGMLLKDLPKDAKPLAAKDVKEALAQPLQAKEDAAITLTFTPQGRLNYDDGCNVGNATYKVNARGGVKVGAFAETQRLCDPTRMNKSDELKSILRAGPAVYKLNDDTIALGAQGKMIEFLGVA
ncbi:hypothetical protein HMPREF2785_05305 [Corynebacterium sp. HMSC067D03]|nr:hypothetical protein HMPREF2785_05305 [Corynebacterium sp. HMSC067D03]